MMNFTARFPTSFPLNLSLRQQDIPCHVRVGKGRFEVLFTAPLFDCIGMVDSWDQRKLDYIAPAYGGGDFTHDHHAMISFNEISPRCYSILTLKLFYAESGWITVVSDGEYCKA